MKNIAKVQLLAVTATLAVFVACQDDPTRPIDQGPLLQTVVVTSIAAIDVDAVDPTTLSVSSWATSINGAGQIAGWSSHGTLTNELAFLWENGTASGLGGLGGTRTFAWAINESGDVAGDGRTTEGKLHAILWDGMVRDLHPLDANQSRAHGINDAAPVQVVGQIDMPSDVTHAFLGTLTGGMQDIHRFVSESKGLCSVAFDVNDAGKIVGASTVGTRVGAFVWSGESSDAPTFLPGLEVDAYSVAYGINEAGQIVGLGNFGLEQHAVLWEEDGEGGYEVKDLETGGNAVSVAVNINEAGQIVGYSSNLGVRVCLGGTQFPGGVLQRPLLWYEDTVIDLGLLENVKSGFALALNDDGGVVGMSTDGKGEMRAVRWSIEVLPATPDEATEQLIGEVNSLVAASDVSEGLGNALLKKLDAITRKLNNGQIKAATRLAEAFINQVEAYVVAGNLTAEQGNALIQLAQNMIDLLNP